MIRDLVLRTIGDRTVIRPDGYQRSMLTMLALFPTGQFEVRDSPPTSPPAMQASGSPCCGSLSALRRRAVLRSADEQPVEILGVSQFLIQEGRIVKEVRVYHEIALRAQINGKRGDSREIMANIY